jgi:tetratricopeptide (TPR) repeat protein
LPPTVAFAPPPADTPLFAPRRDSRPAPQTSDDEVQPSPPIKLVRTRPEPDTNLLRGHATLQRGELDQARRDYEQALQRDPNNTDALLALAAIAQRQGRTGDAEALRQRALVANPSDPATQAATLSGAAAEADPQTTESRLKTLLSTQPESAPLNFALGNLYSRQSRWAEAQQAYFNAVAADGDNPDYLFNLAVSLDHLRQPRLAAQHYRLALDAATRRPAAFDRDKLNRRLGELQAEPLR